MRYEVIKSETLSKDGDDRFVVINALTEEILDDARGYGYKSIKSAHAGFSYKKRLSDEKKAENRAKRKSIIRLNKGKSHNGFVDNYCVVDLETTSTSINDTKIIEIGAIRVRNGEVVAEYSQLVNPECAIPEEATAVNHITDDMVADAPTINKAITGFLRFVGNDVIVGFNINRFDINVIYDVVNKCLNEGFTNNFIDLYDVVRRVTFKPKLKRKRLQDLSEYFGLDIEGEHRAVKDCYLTNDCYRKLNEQFGSGVFCRDEKEEISRELRRFLGLPITKTLVYVTESNYRVPLDDIKILKTGEYTGLSTLEITLIDGVKVRICSEFLVEMQDEHFTR